MNRTVVDGLELGWNEEVLAPRPWTALQSRWAAELSGALPSGPVLELCCGVGTVGLLTVERTDRPGVLVDADPVACRLARRNARDAGLRARTRIVHHRVDGHRVPTVDRGLHLVLADPPYVASDEVDADDPAGAVDGGHDGTDLVPAVLSTASIHLAPGGVCLLQVRGPGQAALIVERLGREWAGMALEPREIRVHDEQRAVQLLMRQGRDG
jgi:methylase of polypeptide subunit release factors